MLFSCLPFAFVAAAVGPVKDSIAFLNVFHIITLISHPVGPGVGAPTMHLVVLPLTLKPSSIGPIIDAIAFQLVVHQLTLINRTIVQVKFAFPMFLPKLIFTLVAGSSRGVLLTFTMLLIVHPVAVVERAVGLLETTLAISHIVFHLTLIDLPFRMDPSASA